LSESSRAVPTWHRTLRILPGLHELDCDCRVEAARKNCSKAAHCVLTCIKICSAATASICILDRPHIRDCRAQSVVRYSSRIDAGDLSALVLLDLSAAFDTVDHHILLHSYGITGLVRQWFQSYLVGRHQFVRTGSATSSLARILCGIPQGSVLGSILFLLYTADVLLLIEGHGLYPYLYADDTQVYAGASCKKVM